MHGAWLPPLKRPLDPVLYRLTARCLTSCICAVRSICWVVGEILKHDHAMKTMMPAGSWSRIQRSGFLRGSTGVLPFLTVYLVPQTGATVLADAFVDVHRGDLDFQVCVELWGPAAYSLIDSNEHPPGLSRSRQ
jgi:hypothetical protein